MAKVKFYLDNGANIHSKRSSGELDTVQDLGFDEGEWEAASDDEKYASVKDWADQYIEYWYEELE